jgi:hypothetical protein
MTDLCDGLEWLRNAVEEPLDEAGIDWRPEGHS